MPSSSHDLSSHDSSDELIYDKDPDTITFLRYAIISLVNVFLTVKFINVAWAVPCEGDGEPNTVWPTWPVEITDDPELANDLSIKYK